MGKKLNLDVPVLEQNVKNGHDSRQALCEEVVVLIPPVSRQNDYLELYSAGRAESCPKTSA